MATAAEVLVKLGVDSGNFKREMASAGHQVDNVGNSATASTGKMSRLGSAAMMGGALLGGALVIGAGKAINAAADLGEAVNKARITFGSASKSVEKFAGDAAKSAGISKRSALDAAGSYGQMFKTMGIGTQASAKMSTGIVQLSGDMASFHNADPSDMLERFRSGLAGEIEPLRKFGVNLSMAATEQEGMRLGLIKQGQTMTEAQKVQARYSLIMKQTADAQGDFERTSGGLANQQRRLKADVENLAASLGAALLPAVTKVVGGLVSLLAFLSRHKTTAQILVGAVATLAIGLIALGVALKIVAIQAAFAAGAISIAALVVVGIIVLIAALAIGLYILYKRSETFRNIVNASFLAVKAVVTDVADYLIKLWAKWGDEITATAKFVGQVLLAVFAGIALWAKLHWLVISTAVITAINVIKAVIQAAQATWNALIAAWRAIASAAQATWQAVRAAIVNPLSTIVAFVTGVMNQLRDAVARIVGPATARAREIGQGIVSGVKAGLAGLAGVAASIWTGISGAISSAASSAYAGAQAIGRAIIRGAAAGVASAAQSLADAVVSAAGNALSAGLRKIGAKSPSKVFAEKMGKPIAQGIAMGITDNAGLPADAVSNLALGSVSGPTLSPNVGPSAAGGGALRGNVSIDLRGATFLGTARETEDAIARAVSRAQGRQVSLAT